MTFAPIAPIAPIALIGPTASGKSHLAFALAARFPVEIISIDSAQVYLGMDIGTAKPSPDERARVPHHLIDIVAPTEAYSAARFCSDAQRAIGAVQARGRLPLLVGGTMLYLKALREGLSDLPGANAQVREAIGREAAALGWPAMHARLAGLDPDTAARLDPNDAQRIQRALEVVALTARPMSAQLRSGSQDECASTAQRRSSVADVMQTLQVIALMPGDRAVLHQRIAQRFDAMLAAGLLAELESLRARYPLHPDLPSMRCVGYRQAWQFIEGEIDRTRLRESAIAATRQLAKRQMTWLRSMRDITLLDCFATDRDAQTMRLVEARLADRQPNQR